MDDGRIERAGSERIKARPSEYSRKHSPIECLYSDRKAGPERSLPVRFRAGAATWVYRLLIGQENQDARPVALRNVKLLTGGEFLLEERHGCMSVVAVIEPGTGLLPAGQIQSRLFQCGEHPDRGLAFGMDADVGLHAARGLGVAPPGELPGNSLPDIF